MQQSQAPISSSSAVNRRGLRPRLTLLLGGILGIILLLDLEPYATRWLQPGGEIIFWDIHFPRVFAAAIGGIALSWSGLMMQTLFRNPLAGPFLIGITPGATFGVALVTYLGASMGLEDSGTSFALQPLAALGGAMLVLSIQLLLQKKLTQLHSLLLVGLVLGYFFGAAVDIITQTAQAQQVKQFVMWGMGGFDRVLPSQLILLGSSALIGLLILLYHRHAFNAYLLGDIHVESAGKSVKNLRLWLILGSASMAAIVTAYCGPVSFVGLIAPHLSRKIQGTESHGPNILTSAFAGAALTLTADLLANQLIPNTVLPINAILSIIGAPVVIFMLARKD